MVAGNGNGTTMLTEKFDAYGEVLPAAPSEGRGTRRAASAAIGRFGQAVFWLLVIAVVAARVIWYPATPAFDHGHATAPQQAVTR
jgi:hypothetical protein